jgi:hexosaminidase
MKLRAALTTVLLCLLATAASAAAKPVTLECDELAVSIDEPWWLSVSFEGAPFLSNAAFYAVKPKWAYRYYGYEDDKRLLDKIATPTSHTAVIPLDGPRGEFTGTQTVEVLPDRVLRVSVEATLTTAAEANLEHCVGNILPGWIAGRAFSFTAADGSTSHGVARTVPLLGGTEVNTLARGFRTLRLDTRMGPVDITTSGPVEFSLLDYRRNAWGEERNHYWFGVTETPLRRGETVRYGVEFRFPEERYLVPSMHSGVDTPPLAMARVLRGEPARDIVIPTPKGLEWRRGDLELRQGGGVAVTVKAAAGAESEFVHQLAGEVVEDAARICGARLEMAESPRSAAIILKLAPDSRDWRPEEYRVAVGSQAVLDACTTEGLANAVKTLRQLYRERDGRVFVRACAIQDWPSLPFRGIHFFTGRDGRDLQVRMLRDVLGALKLNALVWECSYLKWTTHPEIHHTTNGMEMADAKAVIAEARRQHVEIVPLINTFGHSEWLLENDAHRGLADDPEKPYAYDACSSDVLAICADIYREAVELFRPRFVHIGHDEIQAPGFPRGECMRGKGATRAILDDIEHWRAFLAGLGARTMIWGDMFLYGDVAPDATNASSAEEARQLRAELNKEVVITDWHYAPAPVEGYRSLKAFNDEGFDTIASPWFSPANITRFARAAAIQRDRGAATGAAAAPVGRSGRTLGTLQTTWAGYSFGNHSFWEAPNQYAAYVLAAEAAWNGGYADPDKVPFDYRAEFQRLWHGNRLPKGDAAGWVIDLYPYANFALVPGKGADWLGFSGDSHGMQGFPVHPEWLGRFRTAEKADTKSTEPRALVFGGQFNLPRSAFGGRWPYPPDMDFRVGTTATAIVFLAAATFNATPEPPIADTSVLYADGSSEKIRWSPGETIFALDDGRVKPDCPIVWESTNGAGIKRMVHACIWRNPHPEREIGSIGFISRHKGSALMLFGITGIQAELPKLDFVYPANPKP